MLRTKPAPRIIAALFGLTCVLAAATSHARILVSNVDVHCLLQNETGEDEIYMKFNGTRLNLGNFVNGVERISSGTIVLESFPVTVELWESDGDHWYDRDDLWDRKSCSNYTNISRCDDSSDDFGPQHHEYTWEISLSRFNF